MRARTRHLLQASLTPLLLVAGCVPPPKPAPVPTPTPTPAPSPVATPAPAPPVSSWQDAPQTPGDWSYAAGLATFGQPGAAVLTLRCDRAARVVELSRSGASTGPITIRTEAQERLVEAAPARSDPPSLVARLAVNDRLLDAMAYSKGRFAVEAAGLETLYLPAWPEVMRVIDDCR
jgi:hypothetical protein